MLAEGKVETVVRSHGIWRAGPRTMSSAVMAPDSPAPGGSSLAALLRSTLPSSAALAGPSSSAYLDSLLRLPLATITALPSAHAQSTLKTDDQLSSLAYKSYPLFLTTHAVAASVTAHTQQLLAKLQHLDTATDVLQQQALSFDAEIREIQKGRTRLAVVQERIEQLELLLDIPGVVDACITAGYWADALDLARTLAKIIITFSAPSSALSVAKAFPVDGPNGTHLLLAHLRSSAVQSLAHLRAKVLASLLSRTLKLPQAVRAFAILRKLNDPLLLFADPAHPSKQQPLVLNEEVLEHLFLRGRWACAREALGEVEGMLKACGVSVEGALQHERRRDDDPEEQVVRYVKRWVEIWREIIGESLGVYVEVFLPSSSSAVASSEPLKSFLAQALSSLALLLTSALPSLTTTSSLLSISTQLSYCSHAFSRSGLEFYNFLELREAIEHRVGELVVEGWRDAGEAWERELAQGQSAVAVKGKGRKRREILPWLVAPEGLTSLLALPIPTPSESWTSAPPSALALLPPLARLLNAHATTLNALRLFPAISLYPVLLDAQQIALDEATTSLRAFLAEFSAALPPPLQPSEEEEEEEPDEELLAMHARVDEEKRVMGFLEGAFTSWRAWCEGGLCEGVYGELQASATERVEGVEQ